MNRSMAAKHAKAKKMAMQEVMENQNDFSETRWVLLILCGKCSIVLRMM
mgnify:CR=1 FL=1